MTLENKFETLTKEWKAHCRKNSAQSFGEPYLGCAAYRSLVNLGKDAIPLIQRELAKEYDLAQSFDAELREIKKRVLGDEDIELFDEPYFKMCQDDRYLDFQMRYATQMIGNPGILWCHAIHEIIPEFQLPVNGSGIKRVAEAFIGLQVNAVQKETLDWLQENVKKYIQ
jgi:hypothetical protein